MRFKSASLGNRFLFDISRTIELSIPKMQCGDAPAMANG